MSRQVGGDPGETELSDDVREARRPPTEAVPAPKRATSSAVHAKEAAELNLGAAAAPALLRKYGPALVVVGVAVLIVVWVRSRR